MTVPFKYNVKAHPTMYNGVQYRSRLEARWAAFFDLIGWQHEYEPIDLPGWSPDFRVVFQCGHSECPSHHTLLVEVKPYFSLEQFKGHASGRYLGCGIGCDWTPELCCSSAQFGANPEIGYWSMGHGSGGGETLLIDWIPSGYSRLWSEAGNIVQWKPSSSPKISAIETKDFFDHEEADKKQDIEIQNFREWRKKIFNLMSKRLSGSGRAVTQQMIDRFEQDTEIEINGIKRRRNCR